MKHAVICTIKTSMTITEENCLYICYYNQQEAWIDGDIFENRSQKKFVPKVWYFLKRQVGIQKAGFLVNHQKHFKAIRNKNTFHIKFCNIFVM
jgi:hypothetical protein